MAADESQKQIKTAVLMLNMGGPESDKVEDVKKFLLSLFKDKDIIQMPFQSILGPLIVKLRASSYKEKLDEIGSDSYSDWTSRQGAKIAELLDMKSPSTSPHQFYTCFRYSKPTIADAYELLDRDKPERVVLMSMYPQYSCCTTGSSLNDIAKYCVKEKKHMDLKPTQRWSLIDRWPMSDAIVDTYVERINDAIDQLPDDIRNEVIILFSAHSVPLWMVERGDDYTGEIGGTVQAVMVKLSYKYAYSLVWQSKVGPVAWQGPQIEKALEGYVNNGHKNFVVVPIAFVNEHIETLHELDIEYAKNLKKKIKFETFIRVPALNEHSKFIENLADLIKNHLESKQTISAQMRRRCSGCKKNNCKRTRSWLKRIEEVNKELYD